MQDINQINSKIKLSCFNGYIISVYSNPSNGSQGLLPHHLNVLILLFPHKPRFSLMGALHSLLLHGLCLDYHKLIDHRGYLAVYFLSGLWTVLLLLKYMSIVFRWKSLLTWSGSFFFWHLRISHASWVCLLPQT